MNKYLKINNTRRKMAEKGISINDMQIATFYSMRYLKRIIRSSLYLLDSHDEELFCHILGCSPEELYRDVECKTAKDKAKECMREIYMAAASRFRRRHR